MTKQDILNARLALDAAAAKAVNDAMAAARADQEVAQRDDRAVLQQQCADVGGHIFQNGPTCDICGHNPAK